MPTELIKYIYYTIVFSTFNLAISLVYYIYGWVLYRKKAENIQHSDLTVEQRLYLGTIDFVNVRYDWIKKFAVKIRKFSTAYFILSEIICFVAMLLTKDVILIGRISFAVGFLLFLFWIYLLSYYKKKTAELAEQHKVNLKNKLDEYEASKRKKEV